MYEKTWLYKNTKDITTPINGCVVGFNPTNNPILQRQIEAIAKQLSYDYRIYRNIKTPFKLLEASEQVFLEGYEHLFVLVDIDKLTETEQLIKSKFDFNSVQAFPEEISTQIKLTKILEAKLNAEPLQEAQALPINPTPSPSTTSSLLLVAALNAWPVKGTGQLIQEVLNLGSNVNTYVSRYLPMFSSWDKRTVHIRIYIRPSEENNGLSVADRICMLSDGGLWLGLYDVNGCGATKISPPLKEESELWIPGDRRTFPLNKIKEFTEDLNIGGTIIFAPQAQINSIQTEFAPPSTIPIVPLSTNVTDENRGDLITLAHALSTEYSIKNIAEKNTSQKKSLLPPVKPTKGDLFTLQLAKISAVSGGRAIDREYRRGQFFSKRGGYFAGIWAAIPEGDKAFLKEVGEGTGIGDVVSIVTSTAKLGKAALGIPETKPGEKKEEEDKRYREIESSLDLGIAEVLNDSRYKQLKSALDLAD